MSKTKPTLGAALALILLIGSVPWPSAESQQLQAQDDEALAAALTLERAFIGAIQRAEKSVVSIARYKLPSTVGGRFRENLRRIPSVGFPSDDFVPNEFGSGVLIAAGDASTQPVVLTNYHVVRGGPLVGSPAVAGTSGLLIRFSDRRLSTAAILAADPRSDLAVLQLDLTETGIKPASLAPFRLRTATNIRKGKLVVAIGNPYSLARDGSSSAGWGIVANITRRPASPAVPKNEPDPRILETIHHFGTLLQIDARLNLGYSGGALVDLRGDLIGITTSLAALDGYEKSVGYAIPIDAATRRVIDSLVQGYEAEYGFLGIELKTVSLEGMRSLGHEFGQPTATRATRVVSHSPAAQAGLLRNDMILSVNRTAVYDSYDLMRQVGQLGPGMTASLRIWRDRERKELTLPVKLGKWPVRDDEGIVATKRRFPEWRGLSVDYPTARARYLPYRLNRYYQAVLVTNVAPQSPAELAELKSGDYITQLNQRSVETPDEFDTEVAKLKGDVVVKLIDGRRVVLRP